MLREHGLRFSRPRELILGYLLEEDKHVSAEGLYLALKQRGENLSLSTVYLNLNVLAEAGLVREFKGSSGQAFFDSNMTPHYHVVCRETGEILDVPHPRSTASRSAGSSRSRSRRRPAGRSTSRA